MLEDPVLVQVLGGADALTEPAQVQFHARSTGLVLDLPVETNLVLRSFDLPVIGRYFPGWEDDVRARLAG